MDSSLQLFALLKTHLQATLQSNYPHFNRPLAEWTAQEITALQEDLHTRVKGYLSEKWFYTHLKPAQNQKLPRIDMLDMLARYVGASNWQAFVFQHTPTTPAEPAESRQVLPTRQRWRQGLGILAAMVSLGGLWAMTRPTASAEFCFEDADTGKPIRQELVCWLLKRGESPQLQPLQKSGCVHIKVAQQPLVLVVKAKNYKTDTITRSVEGQAREIVKLKKDDYAALLELLSRQGTNQTERAQRQRQLEIMLDEEAQIFQLDESGIAVELYSKAEFIEHFSLPLSSLKNLEIVETQYKNGKMVLLRFMQK